MSRSIHRRDFLKYSALAGAVAAFPTVMRAQSSLGKVNVAFIGVGGRGGGNLGDSVAAGCNVVALCDTDENTLAAVARNHPGAKTYTDYRKLLEQKDIDAVAVSTPDHHHFPATMMAIKLGKHVYCEKPLTHSVWEARQITEAARQAKVATQMGTQGHASEGIRILAEWIAADVIGAVREVHIWTDRPAGWWPQGQELPKDTPACPPHIHWDEWLGPAPQRPFHPAYLPFKWRGWWDFGTGALGDIGCHAFDVPWFALKLTAPTSVQAFSAGNKSESGPLWSDIIYEFPASGGRAPLRICWYDGRNRNTPKGSAEWKAMVMLHELAELGERQIPENGQLYIGDKGKILISDGAPRLVPEQKMKDFKRPEKTLPRSIGHHREWLEACKGNGTTGTDFATYAGPLAEAVLLGNVSLRLGKKITWDPQALRCPNAPEADAFIRREYRKGWEI